ncbi:MAG: hypothetical protein IKO63_05060 [Paludibacteraceae bacterium]|nr:hypothetical protein [Paludibacteraceae bacterium]
MAEIGFLWQPIFVCNDMNFAYFGSPAHLFGLWHTICTYLDESGAEREAPVQNNRPNLVDKKRRNLKT